MRRQDRANSWLSATPARRQERDNRRQERANRGRGKAAK